MLVKIKRRKVTAGQEEGTSEGWGQIQKWVAGRTEVKESAWAKSRRRGKEKSLQDGEGSGWGSWGG